MGIRERERVYYDGQEESTMSGGMAYGGFALGSRAILVDIHPIEAKDAPRKPHWSLVSMNFSSPFQVRGDPDLSEFTLDMKFTLWLDLLCEAKVLHDMPVGEKGWTCGQMALSVLLPDAFEKDDITDIETLEADRPLCRLIREREPDILGITKKELAARFRGKRRRTFPSMIALDEWLSSFREDSDGSSSAPSPRIFEGASWRLTSFLIEKAELEELTLSLNAMGASPNQRGDSLANRGETDTRPLTAFCSEFGTTVGLDMLRDGNPIEERGKRLLERMLSHIPPEIKRVRVYLDSAIFQEETGSFCDDPESRSEELRRLGVIGFVTKTRLSAESRAAIAKTPDALWSPVSDPDSNLECAPLDAPVPGGSRRTLIIGTRRGLPGEFGIGIDELPAKNGKPAYHCQAYLTNMAHPEMSDENAQWMMSPSEAVRFAREWDVDQGVEDFTEEEDPLATLESRMAVALSHLSALSVNISTLLSATARRGKPAGGNGSS